VTQTVTGGFNGGEVNSPSSNLSEHPRVVRKLLEVAWQPPIQAAAAGMKVNYTAELRRAPLRSPWASTANFYNNTQTQSDDQSPGCPVGVQCSTVPSVGVVPRPRRRRALGWPISCSTIRTRRTSRNVLLSERSGGIGSAYIQDSWKMTRNLTVNYGVRYDRSVIPAYGTEASVGLQGSIETGDFDFNR